MIRGKRAKTKGVLCKRTGRGREKEGCIGEGQGAAGKGEGRKKGD